jgi:hypothetical protein
MPYGHGNGMTILEQARKERPETGLNLWIGCMALLLLAFGRSVAYWTPPTSLSVMVGEGRPSTLFCCFLLLFGSEKNKNSWMVGLRRP